MWRKEWTTFESICVNLDCRTNLRYYCSAVALSILVNILRLQAESKILSEIKLSLVKIPRKNESLEQISCCVECQANAAKVSDSVISSQVQLEPTETSRARTSISLQQIILGFSCLSGQKWNPNHWLICCIPYCLVVQNFQSIFYYPLHRFSAVLLTWQWKKALWFINFLLT